jgi:hypothetical protein
MLNMKLLQHMYANSGAEADREMLFGSSAQLTVAGKPVTDLATGIELWQEQNRHQATTPNKKGANFTPSP